MMAGTLLLLPTVVGAVPGPVGSEFQVNTYTTGEQGVPAVATDGAGNFVVVWSSAGIFGQRYDTTGLPVGSEFQVNTYTAYTQRFPAVAADGAGNFVVVWASGRTDSISHTTDGQDGSGLGVFGQRYDTTGLPVGSEFQVNTYTTGWQQSAAVATDGAGDFVVVWSSAGQDGSGYGIFGQRYDSTGLPVGSEFQVNTYTPGEQRFPAVAAGGAGSFVVVWESGAQNGSGYGIFGQRYDTTGLPVSSEFQVNTYTTGEQRVPAVATDGAGNFVVVWESGAQDGSGYGIFGQRYDSTGLPVGSEFQVNTYTTGEQGVPAVATDGAGNFVVVWRSAGDGSGLGVFGQRYDTTGLPVGSEFQVNTYTTSGQGSPAVAADGAGNFVVAWTSFGQDGSGYGGGYGIFGQRYDASGAPAPGRVPVSSASLGLTDRGATRRRVTVRSADPSIANGINLAINPVANGAFLHIFNNAGSGDSACFPLPATRWVGLNLDKALYQYSDPTFTSGPCDKVTIERGRLLRARCRSSVQPIAYSLDEAMQGSVGVNLTIGPATYCALFGGTITGTGDTGTGGRFRAKNAPAPTSCPTPPASCP